MRRASFTAGIGPRPIKCGATPPTPYDIILAITGMEYFDIADLLASTNAEAPSFIPDEFAKLVFNIPISLALEVIIMANSSSVPAIPSANAIHASLPEATIIPLNKFSTTSEIASIVYFLTTQAAGSITGTSLLSDGGWTAGK